MGRLPPSPSASAAELAKLALLALVQQGREPTPENYRQAYEQVADRASPPDAANGSSSVSPSAAPRPDAQADALEGQRWAGLIGRVIRGAERGGPQWTMARRKHSLQHVLDSSSSSGQRLHQRLSGLLQSWDTDTAPPAAPALAGADPQAPASDVPATSAAAGTALASLSLTELHQTVQSALRTDSASSLEAKSSLQQAVEQVTASVSRTPEPASIASGDTPSPAQLSEQIRSACQQARRVIEHRQHLIEQLTELAQTFTDSLIALAEDESWAQGQVQTMQHHLQQGLHSRDVRRVQELLAQTSLRHAALKQDRDAARHALHGLVLSMLTEIGTVSSSTHEFEGQLAHYAQALESSPSLESLAGMVQSMMRDCQAVHLTVADSHERMQLERQQASALVERVRDLEQEIQHLSEEVATDPLTQIANRRGLLKTFQKECAKQQRDGGTLSVGLLDVDNFKRLNDSHGHQAGDLALQFLTKHIGQCLRPADVLARYGGEEFVILLPGTGLQEAQHVLTRLQRSLSAELFIQDDTHLFITFSAGVTEYREGEALEAVLDRADVALYEAKTSGKNRTCTVA